MVSRLGTLMQPRGLTHTQGDRLVDVRHYYPIEYFQEKVIHFLI